MLMLMLHLRHVVPITYGRQAVRAEYVVPNWPACPSRFQDHVHVAHLLDNLDERPLRVDPRHRISVIKKLRLATCGRKGGTARSGGGGIFSRGATPILSPCPSSLCRPRTEKANPTKDVLTEKRLLELYYEGNP